MGRNMGLKGNGDGQREMELDLRDDEKQII